MSEKKAKQKRKEAKDAWGDPVVAIYAKPKENGTFDIAVTAPDNFLFFRELMNAAERAQLRKMARMAPAELDAWEKDMAAQIHKPNLPEQVDLGV